MSDAKRMSLHSVRWVGQLAVALLFLAGVVLLLVWLAGGFVAKVSTDDTGPTSAARPAGQVVDVRLLKLPRTETAVGTMRAVHETTIGSKLLARVVDVNMKAGQEVHKGDVLLRLDDTDLKAKLKQAEAALASAMAAKSQAEADVKRYAKLLESNAISRQEYERATTAVKSADAELRRATEAINEAQAMLDWATIRSPMNGIVVDKRVDAGDTVTPGQTLATLLDPTRMQLVASVRESLAHRLEVGQMIEVQIEKFNKQCMGEISEIVPEAQAASRTFQVKVTGPCPEGVYTGMFARMLIPLDEEQVLVIPQDAVRHVGQLELVDVVDGDNTTRRAIRTGRTIGHDVEVLSGLRPGEHVIVPSDAVAEHETTDG